MYTYRRRDVLRSGILGAGALAMGPAFWREALAAAPIRAGVGPYGPLQPPDANGIMLPKGFRSRVLATGNGPVRDRDGSPVPDKNGVPYVWPIFPDGQATFRTRDGGYILTTNSEVPPDVGVDAPLGGASAVRFRANGSVVQAYRILGGTSTNCAGGKTPWGTWLSCEEIDRGLVWECDPTGRRAAVPRPALGVFSHEAVAVDPVGKRLYLTEDLRDGGFYRFTPRRYPNLGSGVLEIARVRRGGAVDWLRVPDPSASSVDTRDQVPRRTQFRRGEGIWFDSGIVYVATTADSRIHAYNARTNRIEVLYDASTLRNPPLTDVDNITVSRSGDLFVCEDNGGGTSTPYNIAMITPRRLVARFLQLTGTQRHGIPGTILSSELAGVVFDPSGRRMYFSSQRGDVTGITYEITGPFRLRRPPRRPPNRPPRPPDFTG